MLERRSLQRVLALLVVSSPLLWSAGAARAQDPCIASLAAPGEGGMGGSGLSGDEGGIGGSGLHGGSEGEEEGGIGGSGLHDAGDEGGIGGTAWLDGDESGIGGTGVIGTITAFGSACVNGYHVEFDGDTPVEVDGRAASSRDLAIGQVVEAVVERLDGRRLRARRIAVRSAVVGPMTDIDAERGQLRVAGQMVAVPDLGANGLAGVKPGDFVAVSGLRRSDGAIVASRIARAPADSRVSVEGAATRVDRGVVYISDLRVEADPERVEHALASGGVVRVEGRWNEASGTIDDVRIESARGPTRDLRRLSVEGYIQERSGSRLRLPGRDVDIAEVADRLGDAGRDTRVRVNGRVDAQGVLQAKGIEIDLRHIDLPDRDRRLEPMDRDDDSEREDRSGREDRAEREDRSGRSERVERAERAERPERVERAERPERPERADR